MQGCATRVDPRTSEEEEKSEVGESPDSHQRRGNSDITQRKPSGKMETRTSLRESAQGRWKLGHHSEKALREDGNSDITQRKPSGKMETRIGKKETVIALR